MNKKAIFSDETDNYVDIYENVEGLFADIYLRTAKEEVHAALFVEGTEEQMDFQYSYGDFYYYKAKVILAGQTISYYFRVSDDTGVVFFDKMGISSYPRKGCSFRLNPDFDVPKWAKGALMYQIMVDRFANGNGQNDLVDNEYFYIDRPVSMVKDWDAAPKTFDVGNFYGGDLQGVLEKLPYLKSLGVEAIYFNPLFVSPSNHKYDTADYDYIDPHIAVVENDDIGVLTPEDTDNTRAYKYKKRITDPVNLEKSNEFFAEFVGKAHSMGIRVIMDGVFNHCGSFNKWLDREGLYRGAEGFEVGAYHDGNSPYVDFFRFNDKDKWPDNDSYEGWWGHDTLPKLNYEDSPKLMEYILNIGAKWLSPPYNVDGWRLDVAADLGHSEEFNHKFWKEFRKTVKKANPEAVIIAEHYGDAGGWLRGDEWDTIMNYDAFMEPLSYFLTGMEKHSDEIEPELLGDGRAFEKTMKTNMLQFMAPSLFCAMNQLSNHDHSRFLTRTNKMVGRIDTLGSEAAGEGINKAVYRNATIVQMTWPGAPTLYYGDEAGQVGFTDPDSRRTYPWSHPDYSLIDFTRDVSMIHKYNRTLKQGSFMFLSTGDGYISYARFIKNQSIVVVINSSDEGVTLDIPVWQSGVATDTKMVSLMENYEEGYSIMPLEHKIEKGILNITLSPYGGIILKTK